MNTVDEVRDATEELGQEQSAEEQAVCEEAERRALTLVFDQVRKSSAQSKLVEPQTWNEQGFVPDHLSDEEFEMFVITYLQEYEEEAHREAEASQTVFRSAASAVGVPKLFLKTDTEPAETQEECASLRDDVGMAISSGSGEDEAQEEQETPGFEMPEGYRLVELEGEEVLVPEEDFEVEQELDASNITYMIGVYSYYLYDNSLMTDTYARWAFLAAEDNRVTTFAECVREESRIYPRPMPAKGLMNEPFSLNAEEIQELWETVSESGLYPDIQKTEASNGEVFYFSTNYLTRGYATSLAEWQAVERDMYW